METSMEWDLAVNREKSLTPQNEHAKDSISMYIKKALEAKDDQSDFLNTSSM